jgi:hypothetical protein
VSAALALVLFAAKGFTLARGSIEVLPPAEAPAAAEREVRPGGILVHSPAALPPTATLAEAVTLDVAGDDRTIAAGTALFGADVGGDAGDLLVGNAPAYCEPLRVNAEMAGKAVLNAAAFGIFGQALRTHAYSVLCFVDKDGDGRFESAFHSGAQRKADRVLTPVGPVPYARSAAAPIEGKDVALAYAGASGGRLRFELRVVDAAGKPTARYEAASIAAKKLPGSVEAQGARLQVLGYDPATKAARIRVETGLAPGALAFSLPTLQGLYEPVEPRP